MQAALMRRTILGLVTAAAAVLSTLVVAPSPAAASFVYEQIKDQATGKCLDTAGQSVGSQVQLYNCNSTVNQQWRLAARLGGWNAWESASSGLCLHVSDGSQADEARLDLQVCNPALFDQQWRFASRKLMARHSNKCVGILGGGVQDTDPAVQYPCNSNLSRNWSNSFAAEYIGIKRLHDPRCLDVAGRFAGDRVQQFGCNSSVNQQWEQVPTTGGHFQLRVASSGLCLQATSDADGARVTVAPCGPGFHQEWREVVQIDETMSLVARHNGKCLAVGAPMDVTIAVLKSCDLRFGTQDWEIVF